PLPSLSPLPTYSLSLHDALPISVDVYAQLTQIDPTDTAQVASTMQKLADTTGVAGAEALYPVGSIDESWSQQVMTADPQRLASIDRKSTRLNSSHVSISYAVFCL